MLLIICTSVLSELCALLSGVFWRSSTRGASVGVITGFVGCGSDCDELFTCDSDLGILLTCVDLFLSKMLPEATVGVLLVEGFAWLLEDFVSPAPPEADDVFGFSVAAVAGAGVG